MDADGISQAATEAIKECDVTTYTEASFSTAATIVVCQWTDDFIAGIGEAKGAGEGGGTWRHGRAFGKALRSAASVMYVGRRPR